MNERPFIKLKLSLSDKIFEILGWALIISIWAMIIFNYSNLPEKIPIHFDFSVNI